MSTTTFNLRERQAPLKERFEAEPDSAKTTITVHSETTSDDPRRSTIVTDSLFGGQPTIFESSAHPNAGGAGELVCSGDVLLASLAACQEITVRMVAAAMGISLTSLRVTVEGDMDFRGTMGIDAATPVGLQEIRTNIALSADAPKDRLDRLAARAERYCVVASTLRQSPRMETTVDARSEPTA